MLVTKNAFSLYKQGITEAKVGELLGVSQPYIAKVISESNSRERERFYQDKQYIHDPRPLILKGDKKTIKKSERPKKEEIYNYKTVLAQYAELSRQGMSVEDLHEKTGAPISSLKKIECTIRREERREKRNEERMKKYDRVVALFHQGGTQTAIARETGICQAQVHNILKSYGLVI